MKKTLLILTLILNAKMLWSFEVEIKDSQSLALNFYRGERPATHEIALNVYHFPEEEDEYQRLLTDLHTAQELVARCGIQLVLKAKHTLVGDQALREFESLEFNGDKISPYEWALFSLVKPYSNGIFLVESLDWTIGADGTVAVGYAPYILDLELLETIEEQNFLLEYMSGHSVLGRARSSHTLAHELGHSLFNLRHVNDPTNIMFPYGFGRSLKATFSDEQCKRAQNHQPWVKPLKSL